MVLWGNKNKCCYILALQSSKNDYCTQYHEKSSKGLPGFNSLIHHLQFTYCFTDREPVG
ncbi:hypothetical protein SAMN04488121_101311 [Chitinophaga filiformis]|uniref:Uncharacterized protein n=1 Tax=Chitinophaga filiformis TaxID=104663 RepID=A0A1G7H508_CHIFI|nr:hypothetical protein SAMN04488121_101311 [Chitinophaga filiformis]